MEIIHTQTAEHLLAVRGLFMEYANELGFDLGFQQFDEEIEQLPGRYAPPQGRLLLLSENGEGVGCVAMRMLADGACEMKRLYLRPHFRGRGIGRSLAQAIIHEARNLGYRTMRLDTLARLLEAMALYRSLGFTEIAAYTHNPIPDAVYLELNLG